MTNSIEDIIRAVVREVVTTELATLRNSLQHECCIPSPSPFVRDFLSAQEAAEVVRRHPVTIRHALEAGDLHGTQSRKGGRWLIKRTCLLAWVEQAQCEHQKS